MVNHPQAGAGAVFRIAFRSLVLGGGNGALMQLGQRLNGLLIGEMNGILNIQAGVRPVIGVEIAIHLSIFHRSDRGHSGFVAEQAGDCHQGDS